MTNPRVQPDGTAVVLHVLTAALEGVTVRAELEAKLAERLPYVYAASRDRDRDPRGSVVATVTVESWTTGSFAECRDLDEAARLALYEAQRSQTVTPAGHISTYRKTGGTQQLPSGLADVWRTASTYELGIRPPRSAP